MVFLVLLLCYFFLLCFKFMPKTRVNTLQRYKHFPEWSANKTRQSDSEYYRNMERILALMSKIPLVNTSQHLLSCNKKTNEETHAHLGGAYVCRVMLTNYIGASCDINIVIFYVHI